jgi:hypothetical protein
MDPRIRIRIHTKMSWIRNTARFLRRYSVMLTYEYDEVGEEEDELDAHAHEALHLSASLFLVSAKLKLFRFYQSR